MGLCKYIRIFDFTLCFLTALQFEFFIPPHFCCLHDHLFMRSHFWVAASNLFSLELSLRTTYLDNMAQEALPILILNYAPMHPFFNTSHSLTGSFLIPLIPCLLFAVSLVRNAFLTLLLISSLILKTSILCYSLIQQKFMESQALGIEDKMGNKRNVIAALKKFTV